MKTIAFYLPQFHAIPENDMWWGKGFTEWTNTKKASPLFKDHYQPHTPLNGNYYNLLNIEVLHWQVSTAKKNGVDGFCYYHYWFAEGKKLLEKPIEMMLADKSIDMPFCLCWANENWSRRWDGSENDVLMAQDYEDTDGWKDHFSYLNDFFHDERYIRDSQNRPLLLIYKPQLIPNLSELLACWNNLALGCGLPGICFISQYPQRDQSIENLFDYAIEFEPIYSITQAKTNFFQSMKESRKLTFQILITKILQLLRIRQYKKYSYSSVAKASMKRVVPGKKHIPGVFTSWDNTARKGTKASVYVGSTPELFGYYYGEQLKKAEDVYHTEYVFVNAWNEWAEGAHLEADEKYGYAYLQELKRVKEAFAKRKQIVVDN